MNPDGLSYLDLASEAVKGGPSKLVNGYWSPGYPALIGAALFLFHPSADHEFTLIHWVNVGIFAFALLGFSLFLRYWVYEPQRTHGEVAAVPRYLTPLAYCSFLWFILTFIRLDIVTPDLGVAAVVFFAAAVACRLCLPGARWTHYVTLGLILAAGYYLKAAMFPLGLAFLVIAFFLLPLSSHIGRLKLLLSLSVFLVFAAPLIVALSARGNRLTFGDTGRLNYLWYVNGFRWAGSLRAAEPNTTPDHPAPKLLSDPLTFVFASPVAGSYPLWYDPSYWYARTTAPFDLRQQMRAIRENLGSYKEYSLSAIGFISGIAALCIMALREGRPPKLPRRMWWLVAWPIAALVMYVVVHVEDRFFPAFCVLLFLSLYRAFATGLDRRIAVGICAVVVSSAMLLITGHVISDSVRAAIDFVHPIRPEYQVQARALADLGFREGDRFAMVGYAGDCYFAQTGRYRVVAQIPNATEFWGIDKSRLTALRDRLAAVGIKAIVAFNRPAMLPTQANWSDVRISDSTRLSVLRVTP